MKIRTQMLKMNQQFIKKNPVYKTISKPRLGKMTIDKETGERKIVHLDD